MGKLEQKFSYRVLFKTIIVGFLGGVIFSLFGLLLYYFNILEFNILTVIKNIVTEHKLTWIGTGLLLIFIGLFSIFIALLYYFIFKTCKSWIFGLLFGIIIWSILYVLIPFILKNFNTFKHFELATHIHSLCLFVLYGVFIGYTISFEFESVTYDRAHK